MTRNDFIEAYENHLKLAHGWASDKGKLERYMTSVRDTLFNAKNSWLCDGVSVTSAWKAIGGKGKPTLKAIRSLPLRSNA